MSTAIFMAGETFDIEFLVLGIKSSFNLLLGRPWLHTVRVVPSSLHQKLKFMKGSRVITVRGDEDLEVSAILSDPHGKSAKCNVYLNGFHLDVTNISWKQAKKELVPLPYDIIPVVSTFPSNIGTTGLGYRNTYQEEQDMYRSLARRRSYRKDGEVMPMPDIRLTLNGQFCREGEDFLYYGFPEWSIHPIMGEQVPRFQIFFATGWPDPLTVCMIWEPALLFSPQSMITNAGSLELSNWTDTFIPFLTTTTPSDTYFSSSESDSSSNSDSSSENISNVNELNKADEDADKTLLKIKKLIERREQCRAKPLEDEFETINISTESLPQEIKIGKTLSPEERAELIKLLKEFKKVFAWSYKDMPGLGEDIVQHHILLYSESNSKKQKLRKMRPEWLLKIKDEVTNQLKAGSLEVITYAEWLANIVPVPKKDGRVRCCVDFRDLNKASPKDDFPLHHIDVLVDNTALTFLGVQPNKDGSRRQDQDSVHYAAGNLLKTVKSRIIEEQLVDAPTEDAELSREFPDEGIMTIRDVPSLTTWTMYFDGASNSKGKGVGIVLISPRDEHLPISIKLDFDCTNNVAEYEAA
ncbi:uncharacterized protein LOC143888341 [Tasmannia lanceolata]|uniref:uncharacterized protein LOC143888341 n=1 Tax=Tasmannia lanceolata TaxID=3420 RepID=UPI00406372BB